MHQAVMQDDNPDFGPNIVTEELQKGYMLKDRVILSLIHILLQISSLKYL